MPILDYTNLTDEERSELSLIEVAHHLLEVRKEIISFPELAKEIQDFLGLNDEEAKDRLVQFYTDMNIDGNFISLGNNMWGLRAWYPIDAIDEEVQTQTSPAAADELDDEDFVEEDVVGELGEESLPLSDALTDDDDDNSDGHLPDGIEGDLATVEDDYSDDDDFDDDSGNK